MDYRLDGLSPRTFEHLIQALAHAAISNEVMPYGDGPDGGREATFDGKTGYGSNGGVWEGYGIIQAKFRQRPGRDDGRWAESELRKELKAFSNRRRKRQIPEYYIFATNVTLTPMLESGGKDRIQNLLSRFAKDNQLKGFDIWDYDKIRVLLNTHESVRTAFAAWITAGDVLLELAKHLRDRRPDYYKIVINYLQKELLADQFAKLEQAGHSADEAIPLSQVFVDLPVSEEPIQNLEQPERGTRNSQNFAAGIIQVAGQRFVHSAIDVGLQHQQKANISDPAGRFVLIGGPGQGKTTIGQFICQIFRTALLEGVNPNLVDTPVRNAMDGVIEQWTNKQLPRPAARRLPLRVVLSEFAKALADGDAETLLGYITKHISRRAGRDLTPSETKELLLAYPSVLILDGLDEVPASTNREQLLACIRDFRIDVATEQIDVLVVATSRPQGYNEDFSPKLYTHLYLEPLPPSVALDYAKRLTQIRFGQDPTRFAKVVSRLERALKASSTARLMKSPLQVTIMTLLVDRMGQPPQERWTLFSEYYNLIYQREIERDIPAASVLRDYRTDIDAIHRRVGLVLQIESERSGGTDAKLTTRQFSEIVASYLTDEGHEGHQLQEISASVIEAATNRLVFLVGLESGQVGFEIRSLQEFMAAEGLMDSEDGIAQARLRSIAPISNWRNVFLFAAGKAFSDRRHLRDTIGQICQELNDAHDDNLSVKLHAGSNLALDLLEDGPAARQPAMSRTLTRLALKLLETDSTDLLNRLVSVYQERTAPIYFEMLSSRLGGTAAEATKAAVMIARIADVANTTLNGLIDRSSGLLKKTDYSSIERLVSIGDGRPGLIRSSIFDAIPHLKPSEAIRLVDSRRVHRGNVWLPKDEMPPPLRGVAHFTSLQDGLRRLSIRIRSSDGAVIGEAGVISVEQPSGPWNSVTLPSGSPEWEYYGGVLTFIRDPSPSNLAAALRLAESSDPDELNAQYYSIAPWVLASAVAVARNTGDWATMISAAERGDLGDLDAWREKEENLLEGIELTELRAHTYVLEGARVVFNSDGSRIRELIDFLKSNIEIRDLQSVALGLHGILNQFRWSDSKRVDEPLWADEIIHLLFAGPMKYLGLFGLESFHPRNVESEEWYSHICGLEQWQSLYLTDSSIEYLAGILKICWERRPSVDLYAGFSMCARAFGIDANDFPQPELPFDRLRYGELLYAAIVLDLRRNGDVERIAEGLHELARARMSTDHRLVASLRARLGDVDSFTSQLLLLHEIAAANDLRDLQAEVVNLLETIASSRTSGLTDELTWRRLRFPPDLRVVIMHEKSVDA